MQWIPSPTAGNPDQVADLAYDDGDRVLWDGRTFTRDPNHTYHAWNKCISLYHPGSHNDWNHSLYMNPIGHQHISQETYIWNKDHPDEFMMSLLL